MLLSTTTYISVILVFLKKGKVLVFITVLVKVSHLPSFSFHTFWKVFECVHWRYSSIPSNMQQANGIITILTLSVAACLLFFCNYSFIILWVINLSQLQ